MVAKQQSALSYLFVLMLLGVTWCLLLDVKQAQSANWLMLQGVEKPGAKRFNFNGFLMADYQDSGGGTLKAGAFEGQSMAKGVVGPSLKSRAEFNVRKLQGGYSKDSVTNLNVGVMPDRYGAQELWRFLHSALMRFNLCVSISAPVLRQD